MARNAILRATYCALIALPLTLGALHEVASALAEACDARDGTQAELAELDAQNVGLLQVGLAVERISAEPAPEPALPDGRLPDKMAAMHAALLKAAGAGNRNKPLGLLADVLASQPVEDEVLWSLNDTSLAVLRSAVAQSPTSTKVLSFGGAELSRSATAVQFSNFPQSSFNPCNAGIQEQWAENYEAHAFVRIFNSMYPRNLMYSDNGDGFACQLSDSTSAGPWMEPLLSPPKVLTLVEKSEPLACKLCGVAGAPLASDFFRRIEPEAWPVNGSLLGPNGSNPSRNVGVIWPMTPCDAAHPCPVVLFLAGAWEKGSNASTFPVDMFPWSFPHYAECDRNCAKTLGAVMIVPEPLWGEAWDVNGEALLKYFVMPYMAELNLRYPGALDQERFSVVGMSEGARGVPHAVARYSHIFSTAVAVGPLCGWKSALYLDFEFFEPLAPHGPPRMKQIVLGMGEREYNTAKPECLIVTDAAALLGLLAAAAKFAQASPAIHTRFYRNLTHLDAIEATLNGWADLHDTLWKGQATPVPEVRSLIIQILMGLVLVIGGVLRCRYALPLQAISTKVPKLGDESKLASPVAAAEAAVAGATQEPQKGSLAASPASQATQAPTSPTSPVPSTPMSPEAGGPDGFVAVHRTVDREVQEVLCDVEHLVEPVAGDPILGHFRSTEEPAILSAQGEQPPLTHKAFLKLVKREAANLQKYLGHCPSVGVAVVQVQGPQSLPVLLACFTAGIARTVPLDPNFSTAELVRLLQDPLLALTAVLAPTDSVGTAARAAADEAGLLMISMRILRGQDGPVGSFELMTPVPPRPRDEVTAARPPPGGPEGPTLLLCTSGTTGRPRWVAQPVQHMLLGARLIAGSLELVPSDCQLGVMPLHHIGGICCGTASLISGGALMYQESFQPDNFCRALEGTSPGSATPTWYYSVPTIHHMVAAYAAEAAPKHRLRLVRSGAAAMPPALLERLREVLGCEVLPTCSMTECMPVCATARGDASRPASVGGPIGPSLRIADASGAAMPYGVLGEVLIKQQHLVTPGYLGDAPGADRVDGWMRTGDIGRLDRDGVLELTGRSKEVINRGGETLSPAEVEDALLRVEGISDAMAFAAPSEELGDAVGAVVVLAPGANLTMSDIWQALTGKTVRVLWPDLVIFADSIPKGRTGKKQRIQYAAAVKRSLDVLLPAAFIQSGTFDDSEPLQLSAVDSGLAEAEEMISDSIGMMRAIGSKSAQEFRAAQALMGLSAFGLPLIHWVSREWPGESPMFQSVMALIQFQASRLTIALLVWVVGYFDGRFPKSLRDYMVQNAMVLGMYVILAWPYCFQWSQGFATFHRWSCLAFVTYRAVPRVMQFVPIVPWWVQVLACYVAAYFIGPVALKIPGLDETATSAWQHPWLIFTEVWFYGTLGMITKNLGNYLAAYHIGQRHEKLIQNVLTGSHQMRVAAGSALFLLTWLWSSLDVQHDSSLPSQVGDWPHYFDHFYPLRILMDWTLTILIVATFREGFPLLRLMGQCMVGSYIVHMYLRPNMLELIQLLRPFGVLSQLLVVVSLPAAFVVTFGAGAQALVVFLARLSSAW